VATVAVILLLLVLQSVTAFNLVAAEQIKSKLNAGIRMLDPEAPLFVNETAWPYPRSWHWEAHLRVDYNANDGSHPQASILWTDDVGGAFLPSPTSQEVHWRSPPGFICITVNVTVSAPGYESGSATMAAANIDIPDPSGGYVPPTPQNCPMGHKSVSTTTTARIESFCTVALYGYLAVRVTDDKGKPIQNAIVMINGTFTCIIEGVPKTGITDYSGVTDSDGYVSFGVLPTKYNVTVILPGTLQSRTILVTQTTFPVGTFMTTVNVACTPSANQCAIVAPKSETQTPSVTTAPVPFLDFTAILIAILLGLSIVARKRQSKGAHEGPGRGAHGHKYSVIFNSTLASCVGGILEILPAWMTGGPSGPCRLSRRVSSFV
jgi:hypothetical protein